MKLLSSWKPTKDACFVVCTWKMSKPPPSSMICTMVCFLMFFWHSADLVSGFSQTMVDLRIKHKNTVYFVAVFLFFPKLYSMAQVQSIWRSYGQSKNYTRCIYSICTGACDSCRFRPTTDLRTQKSPNPVHWSWASWLIFAQLPRKGGRTRRPYNSEIILKDLYLLSVPVVRIPFNRQIWNVFQLVIIFFILT